MKKHVLLLLFSLFLYSGANASFRLRVEPTIPLAKGIKGHYSAQLNTEYVSWGGFYRAYNPYQERVKDYYEPYAFGASVDVPEGGLFIGGRCEKLFAVLFILRKDVPRVRNSAWKYDASGRESRPMLPYAVWRHGAAFVDGKVYVAGGMRDSLACNDSLLAISWPKGEDWQRVAKLPHTPLVSPLLVAHGDDLLLVGGCTMGTDTLAYETWQKVAWVYRTEAKEWESISCEEVPDSLFPAAGGMAISVGRFTTAFLGGQERDGRYRQHIVLYNRLFNSWSAIPGDSLCARVDASITKCGDGWLISGGQIASGKNTTAVTKIYITEDYTSIGLTLLFSLLLVILLVYLKKRES